MNSELTQYILENTRAGIQRTDLEKTLLAANWSPADIATAFAAVTTPPPPTAPTQTIKPVLDIGMPSQAPTAPEPAPTPPSQHN
jgi:hypothetical protein